MTLLFYGTRPNHPNFFLGFSIARRALYLTKFKRDNESTETRQLADTICCAASGFPTEE